MSDKKLKRQIKSYSRRSLAHDRPRPRKLKEQTIIDEQAADNLLVLLELDIESIAYMSNDEVDKELVKLGIDPNEALPERMYRLLSAQSKEIESNETPIPVEAHDSYLSPVQARERGWIGVLLDNDIEELWGRLFKLLLRHSAVRSVYTPQELSSDRRSDIYNDLTQGLYLRLLEKDRWQHYLDLNYSDDRIEQELLRIEVPNYISELQRERYPESYRLARRISDLIRTRPEFQCYPNSSWSPADAKTSGIDRVSNKMVLKVYGLTDWSAHKEINHNANLEHLVKAVAVRSRDTRRTGRGSGSQIIISNEALTQLIIDIFTAVDTPLTVRMIRRFVMSKLMIEDCWFTSLDAELPPASASATEPQRMDLPDKRPTPLDSLLDKEMKHQIEKVVESLLDRMREAVRYKTIRYSKLIDVAWHCYFNPASPSQTMIARIMGISDSLVSHYRSIFDNLIRSLPLSVDEFIHLNTLLGNRLAILKTEMALSSRYEQIAQPDKSKKREGVGLFKNPSLIEHAQKSMR